MKFEDYPFEKLNRVLSNITPNSDYSPISLTIGEPQFETPDFIQTELKNSTNLLNKYPKSRGEDFLIDSIIEYMRNRFEIYLTKEQVISTFGTREALFNFPQFLLFDKKSPKIAFQNPFYQIYEGAGVASRAEIVYLNLEESRDFTPKIDIEKLKGCDLVILNTPNNPTGSVISFKEMQEWVKMAIEFNFTLLNDECYSDIYISEKVPSLLNASIEVGNSSFKNILVANSISKRSSAPGLRSGFLAGDSEILEKYLKYRSYVGCASPIPLQKASAKAWKDLEYSEKFRREYVKNFRIAEEILKVKAPKATFYLWLNVGDDIEFTKELFQKYNVKVLPGTFLGREGIGKGYIRVALVHNEKVIRESLKRIAKLYLTN